MNEPFQRKLFHSVVSVPLCLAVWVFANDQAAAQSGVTTFQTHCAANGAPCSEGVAIGLRENLEVVKGEPYEAQAVTETKRTLADGSHITQSSTATVARDNDGRTVRSQTFGNSPTVTTIYDPVARTRTDYASDSRVANVLTLPAQGSLPSGVAIAQVARFSGSVVGPAGSGGDVFFMQGQLVASQMSNKANSATESLGTKTIEGIDVVGTRTTTTIPAGAMGNDEELTITHETWYSPELKLDVLSTQNDPRFGQMTYSLTNIQRNEPEAALFQVPADYKIENIAMPEPTH